MMRGPSEMQSMKALCWGAEATGPLRSVVCAPQNTAFVDCISLRLCAMRFIGVMARVTPGVDGLAGCTFCVDTPPGEFCKAFWQRGYWGLGIICGLVCVDAVCVCVCVGGGGPWVGGTWQWLL
jgi:hypothetical protein